jgi:hypothetical protein
MLLFFRWVKQDSSVQGAFVAVGKEGFGEPAPGAQELVPRSRAKPAKESAARSAGLFGVLAPRQITHRFWRRPKRRTRA